MAGRLDLGELQVESFQTSDLVPLNQDWGSQDSECIWSNCASRQRTVCESTGYGSCGSYWPNCVESRGCPA
jgi:hypothetical protein